MEHKFKDLGESMGHFRRLTLKATGEKCLASKHGEIWESVPGVAIKVLSINMSGDEKINSYDFKDLGKAVLKLKVPADPKDQALWANHPNRRHK